MNMQSTVHVDDINSKLAKLQSELDTLRADYALHKESVGRTDDIMFLSGKLELSETTLSVAREELEKQRKVNEALKAALEAAEVKDMIRRADLTERNDNQAKLINELNTQLRAAHDEYERTRQDYDNKAFEANEAIDYYKRNAKECEKLLAEKTAELVEKQAALDEARAITEQFSNSQINEKMTALHYQLQAALSRAEEAEKQFAQNTARDTATLDKLLEKEKAWNNTLCLKEAKLSSLEETVDNLHADIEQYIKDNAFLEGELSAANGKLSAMLGLVNTMATTCGAPIRPVE